MNESNKDRVPNLWIVYENEEFNPENTELPLYEYVNEIIQFENDRYGRTSFRLQLGVITYKDRIFASRMTINGRPLMLYGGWGLHNPIILTEYDENVLEKLFYVEEVPQELRDKLLEVGCSIPTDTKLH